MLKIAELLIYIYIFNAIFSGLFDEEKGGKHIYLKQKYIVTSAVKKIISKIKVFVYIIYVYIYFAYINTHTYIYIFQKNMLCLYIKYINIDM